MINVKARQKNTQQYNRKIQQTPQNNNHNKTAQTLRLVDYKNDSAVITCWCGGKWYSGCAIKLDLSIHSKWAMEMKKTRTTTKNMHDKHNAHGSTWQLISCTQSQPWNFFLKKNWPIKSLRVVGEMAAPRRVHRHIADNKLFWQTCNI